jgi:CRP-like cAMP-binding protein
MSHGGFWHLSYLNLWFSKVFLQLSPSITIFDHMKEISIKKGTLIQREGDLNHKVYEVQSGLLRSYSIDKSGKENIFMFAPEGWTIADNSDAEVPAELYIDALEDSMVLVFQKDIEREGKNVRPLIKRLGVLQSRIVMLLNSSAIERYEHFLETYPHIAVRVPQRMIASYLGVTPETLSAAKSARLKKLK